MFRAYAVDLNEIYPLIQNEPAESIYSPNNTEELTNTLKDILNAKRKFLDAEELCDLFFPSKDCPVFISHSGKNNKEVQQFAQWLNKQFDIKAFIDSDLWGCIETLQKNIDSTSCSRITHKYVDKDNKEHKWTAYSYSDRNENTAHVHMMLSHALTQMIDLAECFIFVKSSESYSLEDGKKGTFSPWIFHELATVDTIRENKSRKTIPEKIVLESDSHIVKSAAGEPKVFYPIALKRPFLLKKSDLEKWQSNSKNFLPQHPTHSSVDFDLQSAVKLCEDVGNGTVQATQKWEKALNWLYMNYHKKG